MKKTTIGFLAGPASNQLISPLTVETVNGYFYSNRFYTGVGVGIELFNSTMLPVFADVRYRVMDNTLSPFIFAKAGYSFSLEDRKDIYWGMSREYHGGFLAGAGMGLWLRLNNLTGLVFSLA